MAGTAGVVDGTAAGGEASACRSCGAGVPGDASFCPGCGAPAADALPSTAVAASTLPDLPGYTVLEPLGSGGSSVVYRARQDNLDRQVAVKLIRGEVDDARAWRRFEREARIIASLSGHPHVVTIYDVGRTDVGQPFLVTEWLDRGSLSDVLAEQGPLAVPAAVAVGRAVAEAVAAAHERGILHRDIKPGNVLLDSRGHIKLADFGIARLMAGHSQTTTASIAFTPEHVAPEVIRGEEEGPSSDVYGLASTVVTALLGRSPFTHRQDERVEALMWRKLAEPPPPLPSSVPSGLRSLLTQCLSITPADRPPLQVVQAVLAEHARSDASGAGPLTEPTLRQAAPIAGSAPTSSVAGQRSSPSPSPSPSPTMAAAPVPADPSAGADDSTSGRGGGRWILLATIVVALVFAAGLWALDRSTGGDEVESAATVVSEGGAASTTVSDDGAAAPADIAAGSEPPTPPTSPVPGTTGSTALPATTAAPTTSPPPTTTSPVPPEQAPARQRGSSEREARDDEVGREEALQFVGDYYDLVARGDFENGWARLSPEFREGRNLTFERYANYWRSTSVEVDKLRYEPGPGRDQARVRFDARYVSGGQVVEETDELTVRRDDGGLVITDQRIVD